MDINTINRLMAMNADELVEDERNIEEIIKFYRWARGQHEAGEKVPKSKASPENVAALKNLLVKGGKMAPPQVEKRRA